MDSGDTLILPQAGGSGEGVSIPLSGLQGEECTACDGNMKDDALFQQGARTALDLTGVCHSSSQRMEMLWAQISAWGKIKQLQHVFV